ncbi:MAG TPA: tetratricopeptide repeat protein [Kofleriaceae bacterium]|jgi:lipopolysaccharide biosynthesis regulator YciM
MGAAVVLILVGLAALAAGVLIGRYYVPDDRQLRRTARHAKAYMRALSHLIARDHDTVVDELRGVVEENVDDVEPYFALGAMFRSKGEHERAIRVHQALAVRERDKRKLRTRAMFELGLDFRAAGMPRRATKALEEVLLEEPAHEAALRALAALYEEQGRFNEAAGLWQRLGKKKNEDTSEREHHLLVAAAQSALGRGDADSAKQLLKAAGKLAETAHFHAAAAELAAVNGNHAGAVERLKIALAADPALAPYLLPGLIAAEQSVANGSGPTKKLKDDLADTPDPDATPADDGSLVLPTGAQHALPAGADAIALPGHALVPADKPSASVADRVISLLDDIEAQSGSRLELALIRAQLLPTTDGDRQAAVSADLESRFPQALAARVASARLALANGDTDAIKGALAALVADRGQLAWTLRGRWQCANCGYRPDAFSWRCSQCRRWASMRMETGVEPPPLPPRERRTAARIPRSDALLGAAADDALPTPSLDAGLSEEELAKGGERRSLLGRVGGWFSHKLDRDRA